MKKLSFFLLTFLIISTAQAELQPTIRRLDRAFSVEENDGTPSVLDVRRFITPDGSLIDNSDGTVSLDFVGGSLPTTYLNIDGSNANTTINILTQDFVTAGTIIAGGNVDSVPLLLRAIVGQTENMLELRSSAGALIFWVDATGNVHLKSGKRVIFDE